MSTRKSKNQNPTKSFVPGQLNQPPSRLVRPRNGAHGDDALGIQNLSGPDGGGKSSAPFIPIVDRRSSDASAS